MDTTTSKKPKDRIIEATSKLFYGHDANTIGVDMVCDIANVSKRTLYKYFPTKEFLVSAALSARAQEWSQEFISQNLDDPVERITYIFKMLERNAGSKDFHGCPMMNTSIELRDSQALGIAVAKDFKSQLLDYFKQQAVLLKVSDSDVLAEQLLLLFDGCNAWIVMRHEFPMATYTMLSMLMRSESVDD